MKRYNKEKTIGCLTQEETSNPGKKTTLVEVTWTPSDPESGIEDVTKSFEFDPTEEIKPADGGSKPLRGPSPAKTESWLPAAAEVP